jgi:pyruvate kinase
MVSSLLEAGVDVFRINASHGDYNTHAATLRCVRETAAETARTPGILLDLQGPKIRLGIFENGQATLATGRRFTITVDAVMGTADIASTTYQALAKDVKPGNRVLLADGSVELRALESNGTHVTFEVVSGGVIKDRQGINLPGVRVSIPSMTEKDCADLEFGLSQNVDMVALSFVRTAADVAGVRHRMRRHPAQIPIIAKIEKPEAVENLESILAEADGVMVARGDLGVELALARVPGVQKTIIESARFQGKFVITATQMLESMIVNSSPTRAEVNDVANAIFDGTDALMLSAETASGAHPTEAVQMMDAIAREAECFLANQPLPLRPFSQREGHRRVHQLR